MGVACDMNDLQRDYTEAAKCQPQVRILLAVLCLGVCMYMQQPPHSCLRVPRTHSNTACVDLATIHSTRHTCLAWYLLSQHIVAAALTEGACNCCTESWKHMQVGKGRNRVMKTCFFALPLCCNMVTLQGLLDLDLWAGACGVTKPPSPKVRSAEGAKAARGIKTFNRREPWGLAGGKTWRHQKPGLKEAHSLAVIMHPRLIHLRVCFIVFLL